MKKNALLLGFFVFCFLIPVLIFAKDAPVTPYKAKSQIWVIEIQWAIPGTPFSGQTSTFEDRCSVPSDYVITFAMVGEATHLGHFTGKAEHCTQLNVGPSGPVPTYRDGQFTVRAANGDLLQGTYTEGTNGGPDANGLFWFHDFWTITGGTGRFLAAKGGGEEGGTFSDFVALLFGGVPAPFWMEGTIEYRASDRP